MAVDGKIAEEICGELAISVPALSAWRKKYAGMDVADAKKFKQLTDENARLKRLLADAELEKDALRRIAEGKF